MFTISIVRYNCKTGGYSNMDKMKGFKAFQLTV